MRIPKLALAIAIGLCAASMARADVVAIDLGISSVSGGKPKVVGDGTQGTITFINTNNIADPSFKIDNVSGYAASKDSQDLTGSITGSFSYLQSAIVGERAPLVSNNAKVTIGDSVNGYLTADIGNSFVQRNGGTELLNTDLVVNLTNIQYAPGSGAAIQDFVKFASAPKGVSQFSFSIGSGYTLASMTASGFSATFNSFSGDLTVVPEPAPFVLTALTILPLVGIIRLRCRRNAA